MASTINDFQNYVAKSYSDVELADTGTKKDFNMVGGNIYRRAVVVNSSTLLPRTNYIQRIVVDTRGWVGAGKSTPTMNDVRVYDSDGVTRLPHYILAPNSSFTVILIKMSHTIGEIKTIYIEYGNPALEDVSSITEVGGAVMADASKALECYSLETFRKAGNEVDQNAKIHWWQNKAKQFSSPLQPGRSVDKMPVIRKATVSDLPTLRFDGAQTLVTYGEHNLRLQNTSGVTLFTLGFAYTSKQNYQRQISLQDDVGGYVVSHYWHAASGEVRFIIFNDGALAGGLNTGVQVSDWNLCTAVWQRNTVNGMKTRRNGVLISQRNTNDTPLPQPTEGNQVTIGSYNNQSEYFNGFMAANLIFDRALSNDEIVQVEKFIVAIYQTYGQFSTVTVGAETTISREPFTFKSFAPFADISIKSKLQDSLVSVSARTSILTNLEKTIAQGIEAEEWTQSDSADDSLLSGKYSRSIVVNTTGEADSVVIERQINGVNINDLSLFYKSNEVNTANYTSSTSDYIDFDIYLTDSTKLNKAGSYIQFSNANNTQILRCTLDKNKVTYRNKGGRVRLLKSDFTTVAGSPTWSNVSYKMTLFLKSTVGEIEIRYGYFRLIKNYDTDKALTVNSKVKLSHCVSSDSGATYYKQKVFDGVFKEEQLSESAVTFTGTDFLTLVSGLTFGQLQSFPNRYYCWDLVGDQSLGYISNYKQQFYTYAVKKVLSLVLPNTALDIDLDMSIEDSSLGGASSNNLNLMYFAVKSSDTIGEVLGRLLKACGGYIGYNPRTGKIQARNGYRTWDSLSGLQQTPYTIKNIIPPYSVDTSSNDNVYNKIAITAYQARINRSATAKPFATIFGLNGGFYEIPPTVGTDAVTIFLDAEIIGVDEAIVFNQFYIDGWYASLSQFDSTPNNAGVNIVDIDFIGDKIKLSFLNNSGVTKYFYALSVEGDYLAYESLARYDQNNDNYFSLVAQNSSDIAINGEKLYEIDPKYAFFKTSANATTFYQTEGQYGYFVPFPVSSTIEIAQVYRDLVNVLNAEKVIEAKILYDPEVYVGMVALVRDRLSNIRKVMITEINQDSMNQQTIKGRVIG